MKLSWNLFSSGPPLSQLTRRRAVIGGAMAGVLSVAGIGILSPASGWAQTSRDLQGLNEGLAQEHRIIWAYTVASGKLTNRSGGRAVLKLVLAHLHDHRRHQQELTALIRNLGGTPVDPLDTYDLSPYSDALEGNLESDLNIAKLVLALECDAALTLDRVGQEISTSAGVRSIQRMVPNAMLRAVALRFWLRESDPELAAVPVAAIDPVTRAQWIVKI